MDKLIIFCIFVVVLMIAVAYISDKLGLNKHTQVQSQSAVQVRPSKKALYEEYRTYYEEYASMVYNCLKSICKKCSLELPGDVSGIYCAEVSDRVMLDNQHWFQFEIPRSNSDLVGGGGKRISNNDMHVEDISEVLFRNLSSYMKLDYSFNVINVYEIAKGHLRIKIGVIKKIPQIQI